MLLDLNSKSAWAVTDRVNWHIDAGQAKAIEKQEARDYLGASILGDACERAVFYNLTAKKPQAPRIERIFERGRWGEGYVTGLLRQAGFLLLCVDPDTGRQFAVSLFDGRVKGHADGILVLWRGADMSPVELPALWECKVLGSKGWKQLVKEGAQKAYPKYFGQVQIYMNGLGLPRALLTAVNADTMELHHEVIPFDAVRADQLISRAGRILLAVDAGEIPPRGNPASTDWRCKMCDHRAMCWA